METLAEDVLRYPIGRPQIPIEPLTPTKRAALIQQLADLPAQLLAAAKAVGGVKLQHPYRPGGWNGRQVIHHVADTHLQFYSRFRTALTEDHPTVNAFDMNAWAELPDNDATPITVSLALLESLHARLIILLHHLDEAQWQRTYYHPRAQRTYTLEQVLALMAWHGRHHLGHVQSLTI